MRISRKAAKSYLAVIDEYKLKHDVVQYEIADVVSWGIRSGRLELSPSDVSEIHSLRMNAAARSDSVKDSQGRTVRLRHCLKIELPGGKQKFLWANIEDGSPDFLRQSLLQRREEIVADVSSLRADLDYINEILIQRREKPIQMSFDFTGGGESLSA